MDEWAIGIDLGGTKVLVAQVSRNGVLLNEERFSTHDAATPDHLVDRLAIAISDLVKKSSTPPIGIGIGMAGQIEATTGKVLLAPNLGWINFPLSQKLTQKVNLEVTVENDVRAATYGEWKLGAGKGYDDIVCLFLGTGIGGGIVSGGQMLVGVSNSAGELGHTTVQIDGPKCHCGNLGCLEAFAGGWAIAAQAQQVLRQHPDAAKGLLAAAQGKIDGITAKMVIDAAANDDPVAHQVVDRALRAVEAGAVSIVNAFNPGRLIIGGGLGQGLPDLIPRLQKSIAERALPSPRAQVTVLPAALGQNAGVIGAALRAFE
jgi:glucokinase